MNADEVFAIYLSHVASKVKQEFYEQVLQFILSFWDCCNQYGWEKKASNHDLQASLEQEIITQPSEEVQWIAEQM